MHSSNDLDELKQELRRRSFGNQADSMQAMREVLDDPYAHAALRHLAGDSVDAMADLLERENQHLGILARAFEEFPKLGWAPSSQIPLDAYEHAIEAFDASGKADQVETILIEGWMASSVLGNLPARVGVLGAGDDNLWQITRQRERLLSKAWTHHQEGSYEASVPLVLAQIDGITTDATAEPSAPEGQVFFSRSAGRAVVVDDVTLAGMDAGLPVVRNWFSEPCNETVADGLPRRHGVLHGRELGYDTLVSSTKTFVLLLAVLEWAGPLYRAQVELRRNERYAKYAGSDETDENGWRLDRRGFVEARDALRMLDHAETSFRGSHDRYGTLEELAADPLARLILSETTVVAHDVTPDGWWAWQRSDAGLVFAIGRGDDNSGPCYYDGAQVPTSSPPSGGWRLSDDGNWSGDCYW